ncbi:helix-turn-helix domain-containing protein [Pseudomonadota bacterium]
MSDPTGQSALNDICLGAVKMNEEQRLVRKRLRVLEHAQKTGNVRKTCRYFGIGRSSFHRWKSAFDREGEAGLVNKPRVARNYPNQLSREVVDRVVLQSFRTYCWTAFTPTWRFCQMRPCSEFILNLMSCTNPFLK